MHMYYVSSPAPGPRLHLGTSRETDECRASTCALPINSRQMRSVCPLHRTCTPGGGCHILLPTFTRASRSRSWFLPSRHKTSCVIPHRRALEEAMGGGREWGRTRAYRDTDTDHPLHLAGNGHGKSEPAAVTVTVTRLGSECEAYNTHLPRKRTTPTPRIDRRLRSLASNRQRARRPESVSVRPPRLLRFREWMRRSTKTKTGVTTALALSPSAPSPSRSPPTYMRRHSFHILPTDIRRALQAPGARNCLPLPSLAAQSSQSNASAPCSRAHGKDQKLVAQSAAWISKRTVTIPQSPKDQKMKRPTMVKGAQLEWDKAPADSEWWRV